MWCGVLWLTFVRRVEGYVERREVGSGLNTRSTSGRRGVRSAGLKGFVRVKGCRCVVSGPVHKPDFSATHFPAANRRRLGLGWGGASTAKSWADQVRAAVPLGRQPALSLQLPGSPREHLDSSTSALVGSPELAVPFFQIPPHRPACRVEMSFVPVDLSRADDGAALASVQIVEQDAEGQRPAWSPLFKHECNFDPQIFERVMLNLIKNPNINSSWLFRADILFDQARPQDPASYSISGFENQPRIPRFKGLGSTRMLIRRMIPRNELRDKPLEQSCIFYGGSPDEAIRRSLVVYLPHVRSESDIPFYHPVVQGIAFLHDWDQAQTQGTISTHYCLFNPDTITEKLTRTALNLLRVLHKHGEGQVSGYKKRVHHDILVPQAALQNRYAELKQKYARSLVQGWAEVTDPTKHVFEDLCIAAFLLELWKDMYKDTEFPGFVDIGCGNGLLVHILNSENYVGWGFDARARKSWPKYKSSVSVRTTDGGYAVQESLRTLVLLPSVTRNTTRSCDKNINEDQIHDGLFPKGTFIISNHADELTPYTPILARLSECPFITIPCCSHNLGGERFRAPPPKDKTASPSTYNSLCAWIAEIAHDCGWEVEKEVLRIPSTRNTAFIGRRLANTADIDLDSLIYKHGGTGGYYENVVKLLKTPTRGH